MSHSDNTMVAPFHLVFLSNNASERTLFFYANRSIEELAAACEAVADLSIITSHDITLMTPLQFCESNYRPMQMPSDMSQAEIVSMVGSVPEDGTVIELQLLNDHMFVSALFTIAAVLGEQCDVTDNNDIVVHKHYGDPRPMSLHAFMNRGVISQTRPDLDRELAELVDSYSSDSSDGHM